MKSIPFTLYDFLGYILPGLVVTWSAQVFLEKTLRLPWPVEFNQSTSETVILLVVSYLAGHAVQVMARPLERYVLNLFVIDGKFCFEFPSRLWRRPESEKYSDQFKARFEQKAHDDFGVPLNDRSSFSLAYAHVADAHAAGHPMVFNAIYQLNKGLLVALAFTALAYASQLVDALTAAHGNNDIAKEAGMLCGLAVLGILLAFFQARHFGRLFADSIFQSFLAEEPDAASPVTPPDKPTLLRRIIQALT